MGRQGDREALRAFGRLEESVLPPVEGRLEEEDPDDPTVEEASARRLVPQTGGQTCEIHHDTEEVDMTREQKRERMRRLGRALVVGNRQTIVEVLDAVIEPRNPIWERISDIAIGYVVDALLSGREDLVDGAREALDQLEG